MSRRETQTGGTLEQLARARDGDVEQGRKAARDKAGTGKRSASEFGELAGPMLNGDCGGAAPGMALKTIEALETSSAARRNCLHSRVSSAGPGIKGEARTDNID